MERVCLCVRVRTAWIRWAAVGLVWVGGALAPAASSSRAPGFYLIEPWTGDPALGTVLIHFDTEPNRRYVLEYTTHWFPVPVWRAAYTVEAVPFQNHYILLEGSRSENRFYRLVATP